MFNAIPTQATFSKPLRSERREFRRLFVVMFSLFFVIALFSRLLPRAWRPLASVAEKESVVAEAKRAAYTVVPFVFMH
jgi:hypothetical protein